MIANKYKRWYDNLIEFRRNNILESDFEKHHILPKSLGGVNDESNIVRLTYREHYIAHLLLTKFVSTKQDYIKMCWAMHRFAFSHKGLFTSREYDIARRIHRNNLIENHPSKRIPNWAESISIEKKQYYLSERSLGQRSAVSRSTKANWTNNYDKMREIAIKNLKNDGSRVGKNCYNTIAIEYLGKIYYGWNDLKLQTNISKANYKANYNGKDDISSRIGKSGPRTIEIVYHDKVYHGWNDLKRQTGVSKHMYYKLMRKESQ